LKKVKEEKIFKYINIKSYDAKIWKIAMPLSFAEVGNNSKPLTKTK
jgi:hypothetical protein